MTSQAGAVSTTSSRPCSAHKEWQHDCADCADQVERAAEITRALADLDAAAGAGLGAVASGREALARLTILFDEPLMGDPANDLAAELDTAARALRNVLRTVAVRRTASAHDAAR